MKYTTQIVSSPCLYYYYIVVRNFQLLFHFIYLGNAIWIGNKLCARDMCND